jgi:diguanylate cyclase (GGDEF)-like protein/PAS domain S-box-containing protein
MVSMLNSYITHLKRKKYSDTSRIIFWAATLALLVFFLISTKSYLVYKYYQAELTHQIELNLNGLANDRELMTRMIIDKQKSDLQLLAQNEIVKSFELNPRYKTSLLADLLNNNPAYSGWALTNITAGQTLTGGSFPNEFEDRLLQLTDKSPDGNSFILGHGTNGDRVFLLAQKIYSKGVSLGTLMVADRFRMIDNLFNDQRALGISGESFIADNEGKALTALRYPFHIGHPINADAMLSCLSGAEQSFLVTPDYVDVSTAMAFRQVKGYGGCIMVHIREDEAFASIFKMRNIALALNATIFAVLILIARIASRILIQDVKERNAADNALRIASTAFDTYDAILITDAAANIIKVNKSFTRVTGYSEVEVLGKNPRMMNSGRHNKAFFAKIFQNLEHDGSWSGEIWDKRKNGEIYPRSMTITAVKDQHNVLTNYVGVFNDISDNKKSEELINKMAFYDSLTQLPNRRLLDDRMEQAIAASKRSGQFGALMFLDLDNFKSLNDNHGHKVGDLLLVEVAHRLSKCVREVDTVARFGGDEFVVLLCEIGAVEDECFEQANIVAEKIRTTLSGPYWIESNADGSTQMIVQNNIGVSIGVTLFNQDSNMEKIFKNADKAMYNAKDAGRNSIRFYEA